MGENEEPKSFLSVWELTKVQWKIQASAHLLFGFWMGLLAVYSWGLGMDVVIKVAVVYLVLYFLIYFPLRFFVSAYSLRPTRVITRKIRDNEEVSDDELQNLTDFFLSFPVKTAVIGFLQTFSAFCIGAIVWWSGIVPELLPILNIAVFETIMLGVLIGLNLALLNYVLIEDWSKEKIEYLVKRFPRIPNLMLPVKRVPMYKKFFTLVLLATLTGEIAILLFFTTYLATTSPTPAVLFQNVIFVCLVLALSFVNLLILTPPIARSFTRPLDALIEWSKAVIQGDLRQTIHYFSNDEMADVVRATNQMMGKVSSVTEQLTQTMGEIEYDRDLLETEKNKLKVVLSGIDDAVIALDEKKQIVLFNQAAEEMTGWDEVKVYGKKADLIIQLYDEGTQRVSADLYCPQVRDPDSVRTLFTKLGLVLKTKQNEDRYVNVSTNLLAVPSSTGVSYIVTFHDVTEERELEQMKLDFVSMAAHELRTPLTAIVGYLAVYMKEYEESFNDEQKMFVNRINASSQQLTALVENLLNVSRIERGALKLSMEEINWIALVQQAVGEFAYLAHEKDITLSFDAPEEETILVQVDKLRIKEVLSNLLSNAIAYTNPGGSVSVGVDVTNKTVVTHVKDTGQGIPETALAHLFTKFFRVAGKLEQGSKGTGLGLYIAKAVVEMHNGRIWVKSKLDKGSTFSFELPRKLN